MKQWESKDFKKMVERNGFFFNRRRGSHSIYVNKKGRHISIPEKLEAPIARRLIKENNLHD